MTPARSPAHELATAPPAPARSPAQELPIAPPAPARDLRSRPPTPADNDALRALVAACDRTFLEWAPAGWTPPQITTDWAARLSEPGRWSEVASSAGELVAYVSFRPARSGETPGDAAGPPLPGVAHLAALYVHPTRWRQGLGAAMLARAEAAMRARRYTAARLWTPAGAPAERFYAAQGWARDGRAAWDGWLGLAMVGYATRL